MRENGTGRRYGGDEYVDTREAARFLGVTVRELLALLRRGAAKALDANRIPGPRGWCISWRRSVVPVGGSARCRTLARAAISR
jgi:hypothetical protein